MSREDILLKEYEVCQQDVSSTSSNYWMLAGIFIGTSSVLLGGLLYGILANIQAITTISTKDACTLRIIISVLGAGIITILVFLWFWLKRVNYLADRNYEIMREIELELGIWKSLRIHFLDQWHKKRRKLGFKKSVDLSDENINAIWEKVLEEIVKGVSEEHLDRLADRQDELLEFCLRSPRQRCYERPTRNLHYIVILGTLIGLWVVFTTMALIIIN